MDDTLKITCFGEVLWDVFPSGEKIGGAPLNVAIRLQSMGVDTAMISCVGDDLRGERIIKYLSGLGLNTSCIMKLAEYPTGVVQVTLDKNGSAAYEISYPAAWDKIPLTKGMIQRVQLSDAFVYGSLVCRDKQSKDTLFNLIAQAKYKVLDVNLRQGNYTQDLLLELIQSADFIKFNDDELFEIAEIMGSTYNSLEQNLQYIKSKINAQSICVTKGRHGALLLRNGKLYYNSGFKITVKDTVGAGDSFLATLLVKLLENRDPQHALDYACGIGALVATQSGANPVFKQEQIDTFIYGNVKVDNP